MHDAFDCYGIHPGIPNLDYFKGGFMIKGNYKDVPIDETKCLEISTNGIDFMAMSFAPEILRAKVNQLDQLHEYVDTINPKLASYVMKPSDMISTFTNEGFMGLANKLGEHKDRIM